MKNISGENCIIFRSRNIEYFNYLERYRALSSQDGQGGTAVGEKHHRGYQSSSSSGHSGIEIQQFNEMFQPQRDSPLILAEPRNFSRESSEPSEPSYTTISQESLVLTSGPPKNINEADKPNMTGAGGCSENIREKLTTTTAENAPNTSSTLHYTHSWIKTRSKSSLGTNSGGKNDKPPARTGLLGTLKRRPRFRFQEKG